MAKPGPYLRSAETARRLGVSGKVLRVYEAHGLIRAARTAAGWRIYGPEQIARLHQVIALKSFGFPLSRIADLMAGGLPDLAAFLASQEKMKTVAREVREQPAFAAASPSSNAVLDFIAKAYGAAIAARIMPNPLDMGQRRGRS